MWSGRFREPLDTEFDQWQRSFSFDRRLLGDELAASAAWARALEKAGILDSAELARIADGLEKIGKACQANPKVMDEADAEDVHHFVELQLVKEIGETAYKLHTGRSRNEQIATDLRLFARRNVDSIRGQLAQLVAALIARAEELGSTAMPSYTHLQKAEPVLSAHWLLAYAEMFFRDADRLADCRKRVNVLPLGSGAVAGSGLKLDRAGMAKELGFAGITANSMDATSDRDFEIELLSVLSMIAVHMSRLAEEITIFSTREFGFITLPDSLSTGSSAMPQNKNPDATELFRAKAGRVSGDLLQAVMTVKGLPLAYNKDMQELQLPLFDAVDAITGTLEVAAKLIAKLGFNTDAMNLAATTGFMNAMEAANYLVRKGVPFRRAHEAVGNAVHTCIERGCELDGLTIDELRTIRPEFGDDFYACLKLESVLAHHDVPGGTAPQHVSAAIGNAKTRLQALKGENIANA